MRDKVTGQYPQTTTFEVKGEPKQIRTEILLLTSLTNTLPLGQTGSQIYPVGSSAYNYIHIPVLPTVRKAASCPKVGVRLTAGF